MPAVAKKSYKKLLTKENISEFYIEDENRCWNWRFGRGVGDYGSIYYDHKTQSAHRVVYELFKGPIPDGLLVCHTCDNPPCINPDHLWVGTYHDNLMDAMNKGRLRWAKKHWVGTPYSNIRETLNENRPCNARSCRRRIGSPLNLVFDSGIAILHTQAMTGVT